MIVLGKHSYPDTESEAPPLRDVSNEHVVDAACRMPRVTSKVETHRRLREPASFKKVVKNHVVRWHRCSQTQS